ncbi:MAG: GAF domain-containing protein, partial [Legionella sp.]
MKLSEAQLKHLFKTLTDVSILLSTEKNHDRLLEIILTKAKEITNADGGTLYTVTENKTLKFEIMLTTSLDIHIGGTSGQRMQMSDLPLYNEQSEPNTKMVAPWAAVSRQTINIKNVYTNKKFDLSGPKIFDKKTGYHSQSFLTVPMTNHLNEVIGVLQLINAIDSKTKKIIPFSKFDQHVVESLASQAAVIISNRELIIAQRKLFDSLIQLIAKAIDEKSPYTGGHCRRVPVITRMIAEAACKADKGPLKDFTMTDEELYELEVAAWLHDCGKITTPEAVVDKATKLAGIQDGIHLVDARFEILKRDAIIESFIKHTDLQEIKEDKVLEEKLLTLDKERDMIHHSNIGGEQMLPEQLEQINAIANRKWLGPRGK